MTVTTNTTDRKALAKAMADELGTTGTATSREKISEPCRIS